MSGRVFGMAGVPGSGVWRWLLSKRASHARP